MNLMYGINVEYLSLIFTSTEFLGKSYILGNISYGYIYDTTVPIKNTNS